jgi:acyl carrier protein
LVELLVALERCFGVRIAIENIDLEQLRTLERIARLVTAGSAVDGPRPERKVAFG